MIAPFVPTLRRALGAGALTLSTLAAPAALAGGGEGWYADFDEAAKAAKAEGKDLFVDFTGSDWCGWCIRLDKEVFSHEEWLEGVKDDYVLVALDYPNSEEAKAKVPSPERNRELAGTYQIAGYPTILMMTADGEVYGRTGYQAGGPEAYLEHMAELRENRARLFEIKEVAAAFEGLEGEAKWEKMNEMLATYEALEDDQPFGSILVPALRWGFENDTDNAKGIRVRTAVALMSEGDDAHDYLGAIQSMDPKNEKGLLEDAVAAKFMVVSDRASAEAAVEALSLLDGLEVKNGERYFEFILNAAGWCSGPLEAPEAAKAWAQKALDIGTEDERQLEFLKGIIG